MVDSGYNLALTHLGQYGKQSSYQKYASRGGPCGALASETQEWDAFTTAILNEVFFLFASSWFPWRGQVPGVLINHHPQLRANPYTLPLILPLKCFYPIKRLSVAFWTLVCVLLAWVKREIQTLGRLSAVGRVRLLALGPHLMDSAPWLFMAAFPVEVRPLCDNPWILTTPLRGRRAGITS